MKQNITLLLLAAVMVAGCGRPDGERRQVLENKGSDTLVNVAQAWAEAYQEVNPNLAIAVTGGGSGTGIAAMINGQVDLANSSRKIKDSEMELAIANGQQPVEHIVGYDALAVFLHNDNPMDSITLEQLASIYGENGTVESWTQLGVEVPGCREQEIVRVSRQNNSGTFSYFRDTVLGNDGDFKLGSRDMHGSKDVVDLVHNTACAIGYSGLAYANEHVKTPCVGEGENCVIPSVETAVNRSYPIARPLYMYTNGEPTGAVKEYLDFILSDEGQCIIQDMGYAPARDVSCEAPSA
ncbi:MAG: phosphate ABC transporter substrate-binding protein [Rhodothermales bacterium]|nr:phosphate ABC transporter substrate-binding protein [Rhodothermales bacterium]MBO6781627.1 phosphate ABC transporter substrate-binding protein [Rhodothermales bacterium]